MIACSPAYLCPRRAVPASQCGSSWHQSGSLSEAVLAWREWLGPAEARHPAGPDLRATSPHGCTPSVLTLLRAGSTLPIDVSLGLQAQPPSGLVAGSKDTCDRVHFRCCVTWHLQYTVGGCNNEVVGEQSNGSRVGSVLVVKGSHAGAMSGSPCLHDRLMETCQSYWGSQSLESTSKAQAAHSRSTMVLQQPWKP